MNNTLNSHIIICNNIKLDKSYKNVLDYSESNMLNLCNSNKVAESTKYSFIKHGENKILVGFTYSTCLHANYMAFQNTDYDSKWFFAFITKVEYSSEKSTILHYEIDVWSTWFKSLTIKPCFVIREHVNSDTLGEHTIPEGLELGEYKVNSHLSDSYNSDLTIVMGMTEDYMNSYAFGINVYSGTPAPLYFYRFDSISQLGNVLNGIATDGKTDSIVSMFLAPKWLAPFQGSTIKVDTSGTPSQIDLGISRISALDGYTPKNKKLLCYPYCYIAISNAVGQYNIYKQEYWNLNENDEMIVRMYGTLVSGCSIRAVPLDYNGDGTAWDSGTTIGKFPPLAWPNDIFTNWQTQNGVNLFGVPITAETSGVLHGGAKAIAGALTGDYGSVGSGIRGMWDTMQETYRMDIVPTGVRGALNSGDIMTSTRANRFHAYRVTIREEYARNIDSFFNLFGYKITRVKTPNITGRRYWNFVQIGDSEEIGYGSIPANDMELINQIARSGVTIWHSHSNIGDFSLNNTIV